MAVVTWDEDADDWPDPVSAGDRVILRRGKALIISTVERVDGYAPGTVELRHGVVVNIIGWDLYVLRQPGEEG